MYFHNIWIVIRLLMIQDSRFYEIGSWSSHWHTHKIKRQKKRLIDKGNDYYHNVKYYISNVLFSSTFARIVSRCFDNPDSTVPGANMGPIWVLSAPDGPHVGPRNLTGGEATQIAKFIGPTWRTHGSCRPQMGPMLGPWNLLSGYCWSWMGYRKL